MVANTDPRRRDVGEVLPPRAFWPAWRFHPDFAFKEDGTFDPKMGKIFQSPEAVPPGWTATPGTPDPEHVPHPDTLKLAALEAELAALRAGGVSHAAPAKRPTKKEVAIRTAKESEAISYGYDPAEVTAADEADLDAILAEERAAKAKTDGAN